MQIKKIDDFHSLKKRFNHQKNPLKDSADIFLEETSTHASARRNFIESYETNIDNGDPFSFGC